MSALQADALPAGSPTISSYRGVTASRQQQFASPSPRHSSPPWLSALSSPSPKFTAAFRPGSPSRLDISSSQPNLQLRPHPTADRSRTQSAIFPSALGTLMSNSSRQNVKTTSGSRPQRQAQDRPVSLHATMPSVVDSSTMSKSHREQQIASQMPQIVVQTPEQGHYQQMTRTVPQRAQSPERPHQQLPPRQVPQRVGTPNRSQPIPARQNPERSQPHPPSKQVAQRAQILEQPPHEQPPHEQPPSKSKPTARRAQTLEQPPQEQPTSKSKPTARRAQTFEQPSHQQPPSRQLPKKSQTLEQPPHQQHPSSQSQQQEIQPPGLSRHQKMSGQITQRSQVPEPARHQQSPRYMVQKENNGNRSAPETYQQHAPNQISQPVVQPAEQPTVVSDREQLLQLQSTVMELERAFRTPEPVQYQQSPTSMTQSDKSQDRSAPETYDQHVPKQIPQPEAQPPQQALVMSDHEQLQQLQRTVMELERAFHSFVNASSPNHSRKGSLDSAVSNQSSLSRPSPVISPTSPTLSNMKETHLRNPAKTYASSPLGKPAATSNESANNSRNNSISCDSPTVDVGLKQVEGVDKGSRLRKVLSASSMELSGRNSDAGCDGHAVKPTVQGPAQKDPREENIPHKRNNSGHGIYGPRIFSKSVDNLASFSIATPTSASSMLRKVGNGMKRKSRTLSGLFRPKSVVVTGSQSTVFVAEAPLTNEEPKSPVHETPPQASSTVMTKTNLSREDLYRTPDTPESPSFNMNRNRVSVQMQDIATIQKPEITPRGILKKQSQSSAYPLEFSTTPTQILPEVTSSPPLTVPSTPQTMTQYDQWVNPFETTDLETLMDALQNVYNYDEPSESIEEAAKHQAPFAPRPISYYI